MRLRSIAGVVAVLVLWSGSYRAQETSVPRLLEYKGELGKTWIGQPITGVQSVTFAVYRESESGTPLWIETQNVTGDATGRFTAMLGSGGSGFPSHLLAAGEARWLGVWVNVAGMNEQPRTRLISVPYALRASDTELFGGRPVTDFALVGGNGGTFSSSSSSSNKQGSGSPVILGLSGTGSTNKIAKWTDNSGTLGDSAVTEVAGNVGIGTATPNSKLEILGGSSGGGQADLISLTHANPGATGDGAAIAFNGTYFGSPWKFGRISAVNAGDGNYGGDMVFEIKPGNGISGSLREIMRIKHNGNVGLGTTNPATLLDLVAPVNTVTTPFRLIAATADGSSAVINMLDSNGQPLMVMDSAGLMKFSSAGIELTRFTPTGRVGIGNPSPSEKLDVGGNILASGSVSGNTIVSTVATGTAPLTVSSTTQVANLNASLLGGLPASSFGDITGVTAGSGLSGGATSGNASLALSTAALTRGITYLGGCDTCSVLADTDDQKTIYLNVIGSMTIQSVTCFSDTGSPTINIQRDDGSPANVLSSDLACSTSGATTTTFSGSEASLNLNDKLDFVMSTAGGAAKRVTVSIKALVN